MSKRWRIPVSIVTHIDVEADTKEAAEAKVNASVSHPDTTAEGLIADGYDDIEIGIAEELIED